MFCFQCQETAMNTGCTVKGVCGKPGETANLQDLLIFVLKGISVYGEKLKELGAADRTNDAFIAEGLFATITNVNWDTSRFTALIKEGLQRRDQLKTKFLGAYKGKTGQDFNGPLPEAATWSADDSAAFTDKTNSVGVLATKNEDVRSLRELLTIGLKGIAAYADHAAILGFHKAEIYDFMMEALASTTKDLSVDEMVGPVMKAGKTAVDTMALLDEAKSGGRAAGPAVPRRQWHSFGPHIAGLPIAQCGQGAGREIRHQAHRYRRGRHRGDDVRKIESLCIKCFRIALPSQRFEGVIISARTFTSKRKIPGNKRPRAIFS